MKISSLTKKVKLSYLPDQQSTTLLCAYTMCRAMVAQAPWLMMHIC